MTNYVLHVCKNNDCNNGWIDKDLTKVKDRPPHWKYCKECCKKLGIDFDSQTPSGNATEKQKIAREKNKSKLNPRQYNKN